MQRRKLRTVVAGTAVALVAGAGIIWNQVAAVHADSNAPTTVNPDGVKEARRLSSAFRDVAKSVRPAVVSVRSTRTIRTASNDQKNTPEIPKEFRRFFDDDTFSKFFESKPDKPYRQRGQGSGVIVSRDGYILTNNHVVRNADSVEVVLHNRRSYKAKVVGTDAKTDVAVLKIDASDLHPAPLGNSDDMQVGDWVIAIGSPFGLNQTVTAGIVSAKGRDHVGITDYEDFIQTDASINPGNSGGPLLNLRGEVIGLNTAIASSSGHNAGIGFAIPSNMVKFVYTAIVKHGRVERGRIGAVIQDLTPKLAKSFGYTGGDRGVLIGDVVKDGPAAKAGLKSGDIITRFNGRPLRSFAHLRNAIANTQPGQQATLRVFRSGKSMDISVKIGKLAESQPASANSSESPRQRTFDDLGMTLRDVTPALSKQLKLDKDASGAVVTRVESGGLASEAGIRTGDVIVEVGGKAVKDVETYRNAMEKQSLKSGVRMTILSGGLRRFVFVQKS